MKKTSMRMLFASVGTLMVMAAQNAWPANQWFWGTVTMVITSGPDGSFYVSIDNSTLISTCANERVQFNVSQMGIERTKIALSMALLSFATEREMGVVINLPAPGEVCTASATSTQGAGIK